MQHCSSRHDYAAQDPFTCMGSLKITEYTHSQSIAKKSYTIHTKPVNYSSVISLTASFKMKKMKDEKMKR